MKRISLFACSLILTVLTVCLTVFAVDNSEIILKSDSSFNSVYSGNSGSITIKGENSGIKLSLPSEIILSSDIIITNLTLSGESTIYANGYHLYIDETVTSDSRLSVYGGAKGGSVESTSIELYGGLYKTVYAGGYNGTVTGNTNLIFGGDSNSGDGINDQNTSTLSPCYIYGGGNNGQVLGSTNVTLDGKAVARYIFGAGTGTNGTAVNTNIVINGGKVMNVYGGASSTMLTSCDTNIIMTGGMAESVFGGSSQNNFEGNTYVTLLGGEVTRRVYTGCYNDWSVTWKSSYFVNGTTNLIIGANVKLNTQNGLALQNQTNVGVFAGSRLGNKGNTNEINTIIFIDDCYSVQKNKIGENSSFSWLFYSHAKYSVDCGEGGEIKIGESEGEIICRPDFGKYLSVNGVVSEQFGVKLSESQVTAVDFFDNFAINSVEVSEAGNNTKNVNINITHKNVFEAKSPMLIVSLKNSAGRIIGIYTARIEKDDYSFVIDTTEKETDAIEVFIIDASLSPLCSSYGKYDINIWQP